MLPVRIEAVVRVGAVVHYLQLARLVVVAVPEHVSVHYGLTGGWVHKFKASYLAYFLQCALTDYARGKA